MKDIFIEAENFRIRLRNSLASANGPRRDELYVLSTALWLALVKSCSHSSTYYELEQLFEPNAFGKNVHGDPYHFNKWSKYAVGLSRPVSALVVQVDRKVRGSAHLLYHPLWEMLRQGTSDTKKRKNWLGRLAPRVQRVVLETPAVHLRWGEGSTPNVVQLQMLERRAGIDSLACLVLLLLDVLESNDKAEKAMDIAQSLYRVLLIVCIRHPFHTFANELFDCFRRRIFSRVVYANQRLGLELVDFSEATYFLLQQLMRLEDSEKIGVTESERTKGCLKVLGGNFGFDLRLALNPPLIACEIPKDVNDRERWELDRSRRLWEWGLETIRSGRVERFPPRELY